MKKLIILSFIVISHSIFVTAMSATDTLAQEVGLKFSYESCVGKSVSTKQLIEVEKNKKYSFVKFHTFLAKNIIFDQESTKLRVGPKGLTLSVKRKKSKVFSSSICDYQLKFKFETEQLLLITDGMHHIMNDIFIVVDDTVINYDLNGMKVLLE